MVSVRTLSLYQEKITRVRNERSQQNNFLKGINFNTLDTIASEKLREAARTKLLDLNGPFPNCDGGHGPYNNAVTTLIENFERQRYRATIVTLDGSISDGEHAYRLEWPINLSRNLFNGTILKAGSKTYDTNCGDTGIELYISFDDYVERARSMALKATHTLTSSS